MLPRLPHRFFHQFRPEKGAPGPKNESFQKMKETPRYSPNEQVYQIQPFSGSLDYPKVLCAHTDRHCQILATEVENKLTFYLFLSLAIYFIIIS